MRRLNVRTGHEKVASSRQHDAAASVLFDSRLRGCQKIVAIRNGPMPQTNNTRTQISKQHKFTWIDISSLNTKRKIYRFETGASQPRHTNRIGDLVINWNGISARRTRPDLLHWKTMARLKNVPQRTSEKRHTRRQRTIKWINQGVIERDSRWRQE